MTDEIPFFLFSPFFPLKPPVAFMVVVSAASPFTLGLA